MVVVSFQNRKTYLQFTSKFTLVWLVIVTLQNCYGQDFFTGNRFALIAGGTPAKKGRFPYMCSIRKRGSRRHACGGTLVAPKWVLTAAHCIDPDNPESTGRSPLIYCGIHYLDDRDTSKTFGTTRCHLHHLWTGKVFDGNDIALCELDKDSSASIPDLVTAGDAFGRRDVFTILGWGISETNQRLAEELQIGSNLKFVPDSMCNRVKDWEGRITQSMICAGFNDPDSCRGDSGGPLLVPDEKLGKVDDGDSSRDLIVGITSFGDHSCDKEIPGVYTRVSCYRSWISCIIQGTGQDCSVYTPCIEPPFGCSGVFKNTDFNRTNALLKRIERAIEIDDSATVERILCEGLNPNATIGFLTSESLLQLAARHDATESAKVLVRYEADLEYIRPLFSFSLSLFLSQGTALHLAAEYGSEGVTKVLIENGANINARSIFSNRTPLMYAIFANKQNTAEVLTSNGADLETKDASGYTALHIAAWKNRAGIAKILIAAGVNLESTITAKEQPLLLFPFFAFFIDLESKVDSELDGGWTPLHVAARFNSSDVTKVLLNSGAKLESKTNRSSSPLHIAALYNAHNVAQILIDENADINSEDTVEWTPLHFAAQNNSLETAKLLVSAGAEKEARSAIGYDPLMIASYHGSISIVEFLLSKFVTSNSADDYGNTPLHQAASRGHVSVVKALLDDGASKLRTDNQGNTPFDDICSRISKSECSITIKSSLQALLKTD